MKEQRAEPDDSGGALEQLYSRPGFMIRRAHQISIDIFIEASRALDITPSQYGVMFVLRHSGPSSQIGIARLLGLDRSTTALVVKNLTERGYLTKAQSEIDARKTEIMLSAEGRRVLRRADVLADRSKEALMAAFSKDEAVQFVSLLSKFVAHFNDTTRVSITNGASEVALASEI
jgi:DNA-binding MarR family transcriptional regulator